MLLSSNTSGNLLLYMISPHNINRLKAFETKVNFTPSTCSKHSRFVVELNWILLLMQVDRCVPTLQSHSYALVQCETERRAMTLQTKRLNFGIPNSNIIHAFLLILLLTFWNKIPAFTSHMCLS